MSIYDYIDKLINKIVSLKLLSVSFQSVINISGCRYIFRVSGFQGFAMKFQRNLNIPDEGRGVYTPAHLLICAWITLDHENVWIHNNRSQIFVLWILGLNNDYWQQIKQIRVILFYFNPENIYIWEWICYVFRWKFIYI